MPRLSRTRRAGFTLAELMVAMVLFGIVGTTILNLLIRQQRFYRSASEIVDARSQLRQAASLLPSDLRGISTVGNDVRVMRDTLVQVLANYGSGVACVKPTGNAIQIPARNTSLNSYSTWSDTPAAGDTVIVFDENASRGAEDDRWIRYALTAVPDSLATYCAGSAFLATGESGKGGWRLQLGTTGKIPGSSSVTGIPTTVQAGAVVRLERPVEYALYKPSGDTRWFLGYREMRAGTWTTRQAVSGPYRPAGTAAGVSFRYYTDAGAELVAGGDSTKVARIDLMLRARGDDSRNLISRGAGGRFSDSLAVRIGIRNRQ